MWGEGISLSSIEGFFFCEVVYIGPIVTLYTITFMINTSDFGHRPIQGSRLGNTRGKAGAAASTDYRFVFRKSW